MRDMGAVGQLNSLVDLAKEMGFEVRHELLGGVGAGICEIKNQKYLFLDLSCGPADQLEAIRKSLGYSTEQPSPGGEQPNADEASN